VLARRGSPEGGPGVWPWARRRDGGKARALRTRLGCGAGRVVGHALR
jgi:hypothetical protein